MIGSSLAFLGAVGYAMGNIWVKKGVRLGPSDNGVLASLIVNVVVMTPSLIVMAIVFGLPRMAAPGILWFAAAGLITNFLSRTFLFAAIRHGGASRAGSIVQLQPVFTIAVAMAFLDERLSSQRAFGSLVALAGLGLFIHSGLSSSGSGDTIAVTGGEGVGDMGATVLVPVEGRAVTAPVPPSAGIRTAMFGIMLAVLAAAGFGIGHVVRKKGLSFIPNALVGATVGSWIGLCAHVTTTLVRNGWFTAASRSANFGTSFLLGGLGVTVGQLSVFGALTTAPASTVAVILSLQGVLTVLLGAWLLRQTEVVTPQVAIAAGVIFVGSALLATADS